MYFFVSGLQVMAPANSRVIVTLGDSITDGSCANTDANGAWPDVLSKRLPALPDGTPVGVINMGIGSNRLLTTNAAGPSGLDRLDDDVLSRPNVSHLILLEGINDISYEHVLPADLIAAYQQVIDRAHAKGIKVFGATLLPIGNSVKYTTANEATREIANTWIRQSGQFDAVLDFEKVVQDTNYNPLRIQSSLTCGDYVHPNNQGYLLIGQLGASGPVQRPAWNLLCPWFRHQWSCPLVAGFGPGAGLRDRGFRQSDQLDHLPDRDQRPLSPALRPGFHDAAAALLPGPPTALRSRGCGAAIQTSSIMKKPPVRAGGFHPSKCELS